MEFEAVCPSYTQIWYLYGRLLVWVGHVGLGGKGVGIPRNLRTVDVFSLCIVLNVFIL